jgi:MFS family permease
VVVVSAGVGLAYGAMPALVMRSVPLSETAGANGFNALMRSLGTTIGAAVVGVVLAQMTTTVGGVTLASENGFRVALVIGGGVSLLAAAIAALIPAGAPAGGAAAGPATRAADGDLVPSRA